MNTQTLAELTAQTAEDVRVLREALAAEFLCSDWQYTGCNTVEGKAADGEWWEIAHPCPMDGTARFIGAANPARIARLLDAVERERAARQQAQAELEQARQERNAARLQGERDAARVHRAEIERLRGLLAAQAQQIETLAMVQQMSNDRETRAERLGLAAATAAQPAIPEGYTLAPKVPTQAMCQAMQEKLKEWPRFPFRVSPVYQAALAAAPATGATGGAAR